MERVVNAKFLRDVNISPKIAKRLTQAAGLDIISIQRVWPGELSDTENLDRARALNRVIITLDRDFEWLFLNVPSRRFGTIYLDLPVQFRYAHEIVRILTAFFLNQSAGIHFERSLVVVSHQDVKIYRPSQQH